MPDTAVLQVAEAGKRFGDRWAIHDISLDMANGVIGLVGPNGSGKTTLMRTIAALIPPTTGSLRWRDCDVTEDARGLRRELGYLPQDFGVYGELTGREFLKYVAAFKGLPSSQIDERVAEVLREVSLSDAADRVIAGYSGGMRQRIGIAQALLNDPALLVVDEPTAGLDPVERVRFRMLLTQLAHDRLTILSTHVIADVETIAERLILLDDGHVVSDTTPAALVEAAVGAIWEVETDVPSASRLQQQHVVTSARRDGDATILRIVAEAAPTAGARAVRPTLEEAYLSAQQSRGNSVYD